jgi:exodeoxyribonuclease V gamma subunit
VELAGEKIWPVDIAEGQQAYDLFRLYHLVESLNELVQIKQERRKAADWQKEMMKIANQFLKPEEWQEKQFMDLMENLISLEAMEEEIVFKTFYHRLKDKLENKDLQEVKGRGGIVFSGLYPGVSMPKKVMAFLGLNFEEFPKKSSKLSFDLLEERKKPTGRLEDRDAFLQAFLEAEEKILLSYIGQNVKDNSEIPASSIINELQDYAEKVDVKIKEVKHPLHAFNSAYFDQEYKDLFTYTRSGQGLGQSKTKNTVEVPEEIHLYQLTAFLNDPFKHHYNKVLGIYYENP